MKIWACMVLMKPRRKQKLIRLLKIVQRTNSNSYILYCILIGPMILITLEIDCFLLYYLISFHICVHICKESTIDSIFIQQQFYQLYQHHLIQFHFPYLCYQQCIDITKTRYNSAIEQTTTKSRSIDEVSLFVSMVCFDIHSIISKAC